MEQTRCKCGSESKYRRLPLITQLKRANLPNKDIVQVYCACIRPILEYAAPVYHDSLLQYLSMEIESKECRNVVSGELFPNLHTMMP